MADLTADTDATRSLTCRQCGESLHRFVQDNGIEYPAQEDTEPSPEGTADENRSFDDEPVGQPIWRCQQCRSARHGPDPDADADGDQPNDERPNKAANGETMTDEHREILDLSLDEIPGAGRTRRAGTSRVEHDGNARRGGGSRS